MNLIKALSEEVRRAIAGYKFEADKHVDKAFTVYEQHVPKSKLDNPRGAYHPLIAVALNSIEDDEQTLAELGLTFAVYGESETTWIDLLNAMETVRLHLLEEQTLKKKYRLIKPLEIDIPEVQPAPFFYGLMTVRYWIYQPEERNGKNA